MRDNRLKRWRENLHLIESGFKFSYKGDIVENCPNRNEIDLIIMDYVYKLRSNPNDNDFMEFANYLGNTKKVESLIKCETLENFKIILSQLFDPYFLDFYKDYLESLYNPPEIQVWW